MTDTPILPPMFPAPPWEVRLKAFLGDLARPFNQYAIGGATAVAIVIGANKITTAEGGAIYIAAVGVITVGIYGIKEWGNAKAGQQATAVEMAKATGQQPSA